MTAPGLAEPVTQCMTSDNQLHPYGLSEAPLVHLNKDRPTSNPSCSMVWYEHHHHSFKRHSFQVCIEKIISCINSTCKLGKQSHLKLCAFSEKYVTSLTSELGNRRLFFPQNHRGCRRLSSTTQKKQVFTMLTSSRKNYK